MQENITKTAKNINNYKKNIIFYKNARNGFSEILKHLKKRFNNFTLLLPGYIGYSPNEGSGIYDPIIENNINHIFYNIDKNINIDIEDYKEKIDSSKGKLVILIVHYFGYIDPNIKEIIKIAKTRDAIIIEDCAHALYTDYIDGNCGNHSDVSIYSLHKMLPYKDGGMVRINNESTIKLENNNYYYNLLEYDLREISKKRKENATLIEKELENVKGIRFIRKMNLYKNQTPQTYPIIILKKNKNEIYHKLNEKGYGVVSLYHTMIKNLQNEKYNISNETASKILNLPVHQDVEKEQIYQMCKYLKQLIKG